MLESGRHLDAITKKILEAGIENVLFMVPMRPVRSVLGLIAYTSSNDPEFVVPAKIVETRYKVADNYKIQVQSCLEGFGRTSFYTTDLQSLIRDGRIEMFIKSSV